MSRSKTQLIWDIHPGVVRMPAPLSSYAISRRGGQFDGFMRNAIAQADPHVDFTNADLVVIVLNPLIPKVLADVSPAFPLSEQTAYRTAEGPVYNGTLVAGDAHELGSSILIHEIGHLYGLTDLYDTSWRPGGPYTDQFRFSGWFDFMSYAPGRAREMLGWHRWILGWLDSGEVHCVTESGTGVYEIVALNSTSPGAKLAIIPLTNTRALVVESRRPNEHCSVCDSGVLVYTVDTTTRSGSGPIQLLRKSTSTDPLYEDALLRQGESVSIEVVSVMLTQSTGERDAVTISRS